MTPAENEFIERQFEHLFQTDDCTLCEWALPDNALTSFGLTCDGTAALVGECCQAKIKTNRRGVPRGRSGMPGATKRVRPRTNGKTDSHADVMARDAAVAASLALQCGTPLETLRRALLRDPHGVASGPLGTALDLIAKNEVQ